MEAVPHELVFMRSKLWGTGQRNVQTYSYLRLQSTTETIEKTSTGGMEGFTSLEITLRPSVVPVGTDNPSFRFRILDARGLIINQNETLTPAFTSPDVFPYEVSGETMVLNARSGEITAQKVIGVEVRRDGSAPVFCTVTIESNTSNT
jgi:hypothetical protein